MVYLDNENTLKIKVIPSLLLINFYSFVLPCFIQAVQIIYLS